MKIVILGTLVASSIGNSFASEEKSVQIKGDLRYRHELNKKEGSPMRNRERIRARVSLEGKVNEQIKAVVGLATGGTDPLSTNQTLGKAFTTKGIQLDKAYITYENGPLELVLGKMKNPQTKPYKSELIWDGDLNPEGAALHFSMAPLFVNLASFWLMEDKTSADDGLLLSGQVGSKLTVMNRKIIVGAGYHDFTGVEGRLILDYEDEANARGNSSKNGLVYDNDYNLIEGFLSVTADEKSDFPHGLFGHFVFNQGADNDNIAWLAGVSVGKVKKPGSFSAKYSYRQVEKDAVLGAFTDSDFIGGGTDGSGSEASLAVGIAPKTKLKVSYFLNEIGLSNSKSLHKIQGDVSVKF